MRRKLFNIAAAVSLLLCVAVGVLRVRSETRQDVAEAWRIRREPDGAASAVWFEVSSGHHLWLQMSFARLGQQGDPNFDSYYHRADASGGRWGFVTLRRKHLRQLDEQWGGPGYEASGWGPLLWKSWTQSNPTVPFAQRNVNIGISHALVAGLLAILPTWCAIRFLIRWDRRRRRPGFCPSCGYDMCATPQRCPECGMVAEAARAAT